MTPIVRQIRDLKKKDFEELKEIWLDYFPDKAVPTKPHFIRRAVAYRLQELAYGGLAPKAEEPLSQIIEEAGGKRRTKNESPNMPVAGTRLVREWHGKRYEVVVLPEGFEFDGKQWRSLTAIARHITGTRWSGLLFFGLRKQGKGQK